MKTLPALKWLIPLIFGLALFAVTVGLFWPASGQPYPLTNFRGEAVLINARGLYYWDTVNSAAMTQANDLVALVVGLPLLALSFWLTQRGSLRGQLLLAGTLGFFLYTYMSMCFGAAYNPLFLVYVALFSLSLFAFILSLMAFDLTTLPQRFSARLPRRGIAGLLIAAGAFLLLAWLGRIVPPLLLQRDPVLENVTTLFIQAMDLGLIVPLAFLSGILLLGRSAWGYLLASVSVLKLLTMGTAVSMMAFNLVRVGAAINPVELVVFPTITLVNVIMAVLLLSSVKPGQKH